MKKRWDVNGCFYAKEEAPIQEDIKVLEELKNKKYIVDKVEGWEQYLLTTRQQIAIENLIARNKELENLSENIKMFRDNNLSSEIDYVIALKSNFMEYLKTDYISKSKVEELLEKLDKEEKELQESISDEEREEYSDANISYQLMEIEIRRSVLQELLKD